MAHTIEITGRELMKNWGLNLCGQILPLLTALVTMPFIIRGLGSVRFGVLSIEWAVLGSLAIFDLGLSRSATKFVAECLGRGAEEQLPSVFWTCLWSQLILGVAGGLLMAMAVPFAAGRYLKLSPVDAAQTKLSLLLLAASFPVVLGGNAIRGVLEAVQRFDVVNFVKIPTYMAMFLLPLFALYLGMGLPAITLLLVGSRLAAGFVYFGVCLRALPALRGRYSVDHTFFRPLLSYGGWVSISNFLAPMLVYADRFVIGSALGMSYVSYYSAPQEAISRATVLPGALVATVFPALATLDASGARERVRELCTRAIKSLLLLMAPGLMLVFVFARPLLQIWLGTDFAVRSSSVLQIFCVGILVNSIAFVPFSLLQSLGRPDLTGKFHLIELPVYATALAVLLPRMGVTGAAIAWSFRLSVDACLLFGASSQLGLLSIREIFDSSVRKTCLLLCGFASVLVLGVVAHGRLSLQLLFVGIATVSFAYAVWKYVLDAKEKRLCLSTSLRIREAIAGSK